MTEKYLAHLEKFNKEREKIRKEENQMLIIKADEVTPEQLFKLVDSIQRFSIENIGLDKEILGHSIANRILNADDPFDELKYYQNILDEVGNVLYCRRGIRI